MAKENENLAWSQPCSATPLSDAGLLYNFTWIEYSRSCRVPSRAGKVVLLIHRVLPIMRLMKIVVIGGGISGCICASQLAKAGHEVRLLEKGRGVGGRMSTRRWGDARIDHGAQFFTARSPRMLKYVEEWRASKVIIPWYDQIPGRADIPVGIRYRGENGMTSPAKYLAQFFSSELSFFVEQIERLENRWIIRERDGMNRVLEADHLVITIPSVQMLELFARSSISLDGDTMNRLRNINHTRCLALLGLLEGPSVLNSPGTRTHPVEEVDWISDNQVKGISPAASFTLHASDDYSQKYWDSPDEDRIPYLLEVAEDCLKSKVLEWKSHRWGFAKPTTTFGATHWHSREWNLSMAGDGFGGERIENAALSGLDAASAIQAQA